MKKTAEKTVAKATPEKLIVIDVSKPKGRPSNPDSVRQKVLAARQEKKEAGTFSKGRPTIAGSARQMRLAARAQKMINGGTIKRGRPAKEGSKRQEILAARAAKIALGGVLSKGRPKKQNDLVTLERGN